MNIVFDFDGVFGNSWDSTLKTYMTINNLDDRLAVENDLKNNRLVKSRYSEKIVYSREDIDKNLAYREREYNLKKQLPKMYFNQFIEVVKKLPQGTKMALLSSAHQNTLNEFVLDSGLEFTHVIGFQEGFSKEKFLKEIIYDWEVNKEDVYFVTDTIRDVLEIKNVIPYQNLLGVVWGYQGYSYLRSVLPDNNILFSFNQLMPKIGLSESVDLTITEETMSNLTDDLIKSTKKGLVTLIIKTKRGTIADKNSRGYHHTYPTLEIQHGDTVQEAIYTILNRYSINQPQILSLKRCMDWAMDDNTRELIFEVLTNEDLDSDFESIPREKSKELFR
jgi:phosphoglycolate phosphatase-like HAD superfamily hydrolase